MPPTIKKTRSREHALRHEVVVEKRAEARDKRIKARELERVANADAKAEQLAQDAQAQCSSKYPRRDILMIKKIFDEFDLDGNGTIEKAELKAVFMQQKANLQRHDGQEKSLQQRQAQQGMEVSVVRRGAHVKKGVFLVDLSDGLFKAMDANTDGHVEFGELLKLLYPFATEAEMRTMRHWASPPPPPQSLDEFKLTSEHKREIASMFRLYDKNGDGSISPAEFRMAMRRCGLSDDETDSLFAEADADGSETIDVEEFTELMRQTLFGRTGGLTQTMLYAPM